MYCDEYNRLVTTLRKIDATLGQHRFTCTSKAGWTFEEVARVALPWSRGVKVISSPYGEIAKFATYMSRREAVTEPLHILYQLEQQRFHAERMQKRREASDDYQRTASERNRTSREEHLLSLTYDDYFFKAAILERLPLETLLYLPCACKQLRDSINGMHDWYWLVIKAMIKRRSLLLKTIPTRQNAVRILHSVRVHDNAAKSFFGIPTYWVLPPMSSTVDACGGDRDSDLLGAAGIRVHILAAVLANGTLYGERRNEIHVAIDDLKEKSLVVGPLVQNTIRIGPETSRGRYSVKRAIHAMLELIKTHELSDNTKVHPCSSVGYDPMDYETWWADLPEWWRFATSDVYAIVPRPHVLKMLEWWKRSRTRPAPTCS